MKNETPVNSTKNTQTWLLSKVRTDQIAFLYANLLWSTTTSLIMFSLVFITIFQTNHSSQLLFWFGCVVLITLFRLGLIYIFHYHRRSNQFHLNIFLIGVAISALLWGFADSYFMPQGDLLRQMIIVIIIAGITAGSIQTLYSSFISCAIYTTLVMVPLIIWLFIQDKFDYSILGICMVLYLVFLLMTSRRSASLLESKLKLSYENVNLIEDLAENNLNLQKSYHSLLDSEERFRSLMQNSPTGTAISDLNGHFVDVNDALCHFFGYTRQELLKKNFQDLTYPKDLPYEMKLFHDLIQGKISYYQIDKRHIHKDGHLIWTLLTATGLKSASGKIEQTTGLLQDISERKQHEREQSLIIKISEVLQICASCNEVYSKLGLIAQELIPEFSGVLAIKNDENQMMEIVSQWGKDKLIKKQFPFSDCYGLRNERIIIGDDDKQNLLCPHYLAYPRGGYICNPLIVHDKILGCLYFYSDSKPVIRKNIKNITSIFGDIVKITITNIKLRELLEDQSTHDPLTGLYNRRYLNEILPHELQRIMRNKGKLCIAMLDLDLFKNFNDSYGHEAGDEVLKFIGLHLRERFRGSDLACRFGGEEFIVVLVDVDVAIAFDRLQNIREEIKQAKVFFQNKLLPSITISIGISEAPKNGYVQDDIIRAADDALYVAKRMGRNRVEIFRDAKIGNT